jgi:hypothetical protein
LRPLGQRNVLPGVSNEHCQLWLTQTRTAAKVFYFIGQPNRSFPGSTATLCSCHINENVTQLIRR